MQASIPITRQQLWGLKVACISALFAVGSLHAAPTNPFQSIVDANAFRLRPPLPPRIEVPPPPSKPQITAKLTGLTSMFGHKTPMAFVEIQEAGKTAVTRVVLKVGEQADGVTVVAIDVRQGTASVRIAGVESVLALDKMEPDRKAALGNPLIQPAGLAISSVPPRR
jgi:hypothetical protein